VILRLLVLLAASTQALAQLPPLAEVHAPTLRVELLQHWPEAPYKHMFGGQVEQETCISLRHSRCWSPTAELKTDREYGFGLGQITITSAFDNFQEAKKLDPTLGDWDWENRYNAQFQLRAMVLKDKFNFGKFSWAFEEYERMAFTFASYNGGVGGVLSDRRVCAVTEGCDVSKWFGHVEHTSKKAKVPKSGYGKSFFMINREYVVNILTVRSAKYQFVLAPSN